MRLLRKKRKGFVLAESVVSLFITVLIAFTLTICLGEQYQKIKLFEQRVNAHKLMLINLDSHQDVSKQIVRNQTYLYEKSENKLKVKVDRELYQVEW